MPRLTIRTWGAAAAAALLLGPLSIHAQTATTTTLTVPASPVSSTSSISLQATVVPGAMGTVSFRAGGQSLGGAPVSLVAGGGDCNPPPDAAPTASVRAAAAKTAAAKAATAKAAKAGAGTTNCGSDSYVGIAILTLPPGTLAAGSYGIKAYFESDDFAFDSSISAGASLTITTPSGTLPTPPSSPTPVTNFEYDAEGRPTKTVVAPDTRNYATLSDYDALGRRKTTMDAKNGITQFGYDLQDQLTSVTDPRQLVTQYQPTGLGDVMALTSPDTGTASSTFDAAGNLKTRTDARGALATYSYDVLNRAIQVVYSRQGDTNRTLGWTYDETGASFGYGKGRLTTATTPDASTTFRYDALGRVTATVQTSAAGTPLVVNTGYDDAGHVKSLTYPSGRSITFGWANGQPTSINITSGSSTTTLLDQVVMSPFGPAQSWVWKLGTAKPHERVYDTNSRLVRQPLGTLVRDITYDDADRISRYTHYTAATAQAATAYDQSFGYDELNRLTTVTAATNWSYGYDANGNRTASAVGISTRGYSVSATSNRLDALTGPPRSMGYDAAGNTLSDVQSGSSSNYTATYSLEGRLAAMAQGTSVGVEFGYDAMGRRVTRGQWTGSTSNPRVYTLYAYDLANHLIGEYQANGTLITEYVWFGDTPVAVIKPDATAPGGIQIYAIHTDHLDTPRVILDAQGNVRWRWMGEPFGASAAEEQPTAGLAALQQNLRFPGQQYEAFGGRHYNHFRDYDPTTGRYAQSDPIGLAGGINTYAYVSGNPLSVVDPMGLYGCKWVGPVLECDFNPPPVPNPDLPPSSPPALEWPKLLPDSWVDWIIEKVKGKWSCSASCNVQQINPNVCCPDRVTGTATGPNEPAACVEAKRAATQSTPAGCYPRHCQCRCSKQ